MKEMKEMKDFSVKNAVKNVMLDIDYSRLIGRTDNKNNDMAEVSILNRYEQYYELYNDLLKQYNGVHSSSKKCVENGVFVAIKGMKFNGLDYTLNAVEHGARLIVFDENNLENLEANEFIENFIDNLGARFLKVYDAREFLAFAARYYTSDRHTDRHIKATHATITNTTKKHTSSPYDTEMSQNKNNDNQPLSQPEFLIAVTGTDGKTSTCVFIYQIMKLLKLSCMYMGTIGVKVYEATTQAKPQTKPDIKLQTKTHTKWKETEFSQNLTTFPVEDFFDLMSQYKNVNVCAFEASSIGIDQHRITFADIAVGIFTNLHEDHIDIHGSYENYKNAKLKLFSKLLSSDGTAIVFDDLQPSVMTEVRNICAERGIKLLTYGEKNSSSFNILNLRKVPQGYEFDIKFDIEAQTVISQTVIIPIFVPVFVKFQVYNIVAAIIAIMQYGFELSDILKIVNLLHGVKGRMERVFLDAPVSPNMPTTSLDTHTITENLNIFVDYAHTPNALQTLLENVRQSYSKIVVVFGCGGERDATKRSKMGAIASELANITVITDDNPRNEDAASIRKEVLSKCPNGIEASCRRDAIFKGVKLLIDIVKAIVKESDTENNHENCCLIIAGKGHENYQIIGNEKIDFDDYAVAQEAVQEAMIYFDQIEGE